MLYSRAVARLAAPLVCTVDKILSLFANARKRFGLLDEARQLFRCHGAATAAAISLFCATAYSHPSLAEQAIWADNIDSDEALDWSGSETTVTGTIHSNSGIKIVGPNR